MLNPVQTRRTERVRLAGHTLIRQHGKTALRLERNTVAWTTWAEIGAQVEAALQTYHSPDESTYNAVARSPGR